LAVGLLAALFVFTIGVGLTLTTEATFVQTLFEAVSAFGTVGASTGITPDLTDPARLITAVAMFVGRLGPLTLVLALAARAHPVAFRPAVEQVRIG
ncbi:MAG TPA: potassium transporter TrkG, partial [Candidatus Limnocylindria bacterium]|nr:potassium transporter TrkG [Candidatus Limnocylindria bacterium]